jgi:uncharacterized repeat protein (TIGR01451 family)
MTSGFGPAPVVFAADFPPGGDDARLCADGVFAAGTFSGEIVVCERGAYGRVAKGQTVFDGGAGGYILAQSNLVGGGPGAVTSDPHVLPAVHIDYAGYQDLLGYVAITGSSDGTIAGAVLDSDPVHGDIMASFSSRGPNGSLPDILKPSVTAPGRSIWAAYHQGSGGDGTYTYNVIQGTSMSSPHVAGAGALMKAIHPTWSPAEIESALMNTARTTVLNDDGVSPTTATWFDQGSGHVDLNLAGQAGLVLDVTTAEYQAADPSAGGDPKSLNLASMGNASCLNSCEWTRTVKSSVDYTSLWTVSASGENSLVVTASPVTFTLAAGAEQDIVVTADVSGVASGVWTFGEVTIEELPQEGLQMPAVHLPVGVMGAASILPDQVEIDTRRNAGSQLVEGLQSDEITDLTIDNYGLVQGTQVTELLDQDPTDGDPYDTITGTFRVTTTVPAGAVRLVAEIIDSDAPDIDLFVGTGDTPSAATQVCASTTPTAVEYCEVSEPAGGTWWILVQNWEASLNPPDLTTLSYAVVPGSDAGNMTVTGPTTNPAGTPYDLRVFWDTPSMMYGDRWYGAFDIGTSPSNPGDIGRLPVNIVRWEDDVLKVASSGTALLGDTVTYTITVQPNVTPVELTYWITDTIPTGMTYVTGTANANVGTVGVVGDVLTWTGAMPSEGFYTVADSTTDPTNCVVPLANSGAYTDLAGYGILANPSISGDTLVVNWTTSGDPDHLEFFGKDVGNVWHFTDDGFAFFDPSTPGAAPWSNQPIPSASDPNNLMAILWNDFEIVYDQATNRGVTTANLGPGGQPPFSAHIFEFDDMEPWPVGSTNIRYDFEVFVWRDVSFAPGDYEIFFAYDNLTGLTGDGTIGVENGTGTAGAQIAYGDVAVTDGMAICFDWTLPTQEAVITFDVTVDADATCPATVTNTAYNQTDNPGSMVEMASTDVVVSNCVPTDVSMSGIDVKSNAASLIPLLIAMGVAVLVAGGVALRRRREV